MRMTFRIATLLSACIKLPTLRSIPRRLALLAGIAVAAASHGQTKLYIVNSGSSDISVVDTSLGVVTNTIPGPGHLTPIAFDPTTGLLNVPTQESPGRIYLIDPTSDSFVGNPLTVGAFPIYMSITPELHRGYVSNFFGGVSVVDTTNHALATEINSVFWPVGTASDAALSKLYVMNTQTSELSVIDVNTNIRIKSISIGIGCSQPLDVKVDTLLHKAFASKGSCPALAVFDTIADSLAATISLPGKPQYISVDSAAHRAYVTYTAGVLGETGTSGGLAVIDTSTNSVVASFAAGKNPTRLTLNAPENRLYITDRGNNSVLVVDTIANQVIKQIPVGIDPVDLALVQMPSPRLSVSAQNLSFDPQSIGTISSSQTLQVKNEGNANLIIQATSILGAAFQFTKNTCQGATLLPASVCYLAVSFSPVTAGSDAGTLTLVTNDASIPTATIPLTGTVKTRSGVTIERISPAIGEGGTAILIRGRNFGARQGNSAVNIAGTPARIKSWNRTRIEATVPDGLSGVEHLIVITNEGTSNAVEFTYASSDAPVWRRLNGPWGKECDAVFSAIAVHPSNPALIYIASAAQGRLGCGVYASGNGGITWKAANRGIPRSGVPPHYASVSRIAIAPSDPKTIYLGTFSAETQTGRILKSVDSGFSWADASGSRPLASTIPTIQFPVLDIAVHPHDPNTSYAAISGGVYKTTDGGRTWTNIVHGRTPGPAIAVDDYATIRIAPSNPGAVYVLGFTSATGFALPCSLIIGECTEINNALPLAALKTADGGKTWSPITNPTIATFQGLNLDALLTDITVDPSRENVLIASTMSYIAPVAGVAVITNNRGVFGSPDGGSTWSAMNGAATSGVSNVPISRLVSKPDVPATLLALTRTANTAFITTDGGSSWQRLTGLGLEDPTFIFDVAFAGTKLYAATSRGVYVLDNPATISK